MKVNGPLTHARFAAEASRIVRQASKWVAHETLRIHTGEYLPQHIVSDNDRVVFVKEITEILDKINYK
jgi:hypothetical protein